MGYINNPSSASGGASPAGSGTEIQYRLNSTAFGAVSGSIYTAATDYTGLGITPTNRLHVKATSTTLAPPTGLAVISTAEVLAVAPTATATEVVGPADSSGTAIAAPSQVDGSGSYFSDGSTNITYSVFAYKTISGLGNYYVGSPSTVGFIDNSSSSPFTNALSWSSVSGADGYFVTAAGSANNGNPNWAIDVGNVTTYNDDGVQSSAGTAPTLFSTICFYPPGPPTANDPNTFGGSANAGYSNYPDDGSITSIGYDIYAYDNSGLIKYYSNNPTSGTIFPPSLGGTFGPDLTWVSGGSQTGFKIIITVNLSAGGTTVGSYDASNVLLLSNFVANSADLTVTPPVSSYTPATTRNYSAYGLKTSPITSYSASGNTYSVTDSAPAQGYIIRHDVTYGATPTAFILGSPGGSGLTNSYTTTATTFYETASPSIFTGSNTVTPVHYGILATGQTYNFKAYASATSPYTYYSTLFSTATFTFPNNSNYYYLTLSWVNGGGTGIRFLRDIGSGYAEYYDTSGTSFDYFDLTPSWGSGTTVTPNTVEDTAVTLENASAHQTDSSQLILKSTGSSPFMRLDFNDNTDANKLSIGNDSSNGMKMFASGSYFDFYGTTVGLISRIGSQFTTLNFPHSASYYLQVNRASSGTVFKVLSNVSGRTRAFFGNDTTDTFGACVAVTPDHSSDEGIFVNHPIANGIVFRAANSATGSVTILMNASGKIALNRTIIGSGLLTIGPGDSSNPQVTFDDTSTVSTNVGGLTRKTSDGGLRYNYVAGTPTRLITDTGTDISTGVLPKMASSSSQMVASGISDNGSIITFSASLSVLFSNGLSISGSKNLTNSGNYAGGFQATLGSAAISTTLNRANHSPFFEFTGSTAGRTLTLPTAASTAGLTFQIFNRASVSVTVATTSSQNINIGTGTVTSLVLQPGDSVKFVATASSTWDAFAYTQNIVLVANGGTGVTSLGALTKTDDTNVTLTLGGSPTTALVNAASLALGWTGTLSVARGGSGDAISFKDNVALTNQGADIAATNFTNGGTAGTYRVSYCLLDTTADLTAGAVTLTFGFTDAAGATTLPSAALPLTAVGRTQGSIYIQLASGNITYSTTHTGLFGTSKYALYMSLERLS